MMVMLDRMLDEKLLELQPYLEANFKDDKKFDLFLDEVMKRTPETLEDPNEKAIYKLVMDSRTLLNDIKLVEERFDKQAREFEEKIQIPYFVYRHPVLREFWLKRSKECYVNIEAKDSLMLPRGNITPDYLAQYMHEGEIKKLDKLNKFEPGPIAPQIPDYDINNRNDAIIERANILGDVLNRIADDVKSEKLILNNKQILIEHEDKKKDDLMFGSQKPRLVQGKIHLEEIRRCLELNNKNPETYGVVFFADYFGISIPEIKSILEGFSYPIIRGGRVIKVLRFFDVNEASAFM